MIPVASNTARALFRHALGVGSLLVLGFAANALGSEEWTPTRSFRTFSKSAWRGLPQSSVVALAQSTDGVLWIGTLDGVATFDGKTIAPVRDVAGAPVRGIINSIVPRRKGGVYVASQSGVHIYDGAAWRLLPTKSGIVSITESRDGVLWMADSDGVVWSLHTRDSWRRRHEIDIRVLAISAAADGSIWIATESGAARVHKGRVEPVGGDPLPARPAVILAASDGRVWIATQNCTVHWSSGGTDGWHQADFAPWPRGAFRSLAEDRRGRIWAGSVGGRLAWGNATMPWRVWGPAHGPFGAGVMAILGDREGHVWFGLNAVGLAQWIGEGWSHRIATPPESGAPQGFSASFGLSRPLSSPGLLVASFSTGASLFTEDGQRKTFTAANGLTEDVRAFVEAEPGLYIAGTRFGIFESKNGEPFRHVLKLPAGFVMGLFQSPEGRWYAASSVAGVFVRDGGTWRPDEAINNSLDNKHVRAMMWRRNGELWVATLRGVTIFRNAVFADHLTSRSEPAFPESVNTLLETSKGDVWVGGTGNGAVFREGRWQKMTVADGIPGQTIYSLAEDRHGAVWAGGSAGVGRYADGRWKVWDSREGLIQEECNLHGLLIADDESVYVSTMSGLARFDPKVKTLPPPPLQLKWISTPARDGSGVSRISGRDRSLHLRWSAAWLGAQPVEYRVRVPRLRDSWSAPTTENHIDIENLTAGNWQVEVAARVEGTTNWTAPLVLNVAVAPFWYETLAVRLAMVALLALLIYLAVRLRMRALRHRAAALESLVRDRTAELAEKVEQLRVSEQRAQAASHAKSAFLANMSHELRTPLNGILGFAQLMMRRSNRDAEDHHRLGVIVNSGEHLLNLINEVLSLSKIEAGRLTIEQGRFDLRTVIREVENVLRFRAEEKGLKFTTVIDESQLPEAVMGDQLRLRQILLNLLGNAVKFTDRGGVTFRLRWRGGRARFEVEDTGPGIASDELASLFQPFVQSATGHRSKEGTGLGLALSRDLAQLMEGDITVESTPGVGSRFVLEIKLPEAEAEAERADAREVRGLASGHPPIRILVVDDTAVNRLVLTQLLTQAGFETREAANGEEALTAWRSWKPHLIWIDKRMPDMDGLEVTRRIRREEKTSGGHTPIIALSASALDHERDEILAAGCDEFVSKPFRTSTIFEKIREYLGVTYEYEEHPIRDAVVDAGTGSLQPVRSGTAQILVVDDDPICRDVASEILRDNGVGVTTVSNGPEALHLLESERFDLVMVDLRMPVMSGTEIARRIRANPHHDRLPIIAMSADSADDDTIPRAHSGIDDHVSKPVDPDAIAAILAKWLPAPVV